MELAKVCRKEPHPEEQASFKKMLSIVPFLILKHLKPYKVKIDLAHAAEDPEKVAKMYQYYGMALPFLPKDAQFASDFGEDKMEFGVKMKGRFFLFYLVFHVLKLILNKKVKKFIKLVKREDM